MQDIASVLHPIFCLMHEIIERLNVFSNIIQVVYLVNNSIHEHVNCIEKIIEEMKNQIEECKLTKYVNIPERQENYINKLQLAFNNRIKWLKDRDKGGELHEEYMKEININISQNIAKLRNVGYYEQDK